MRISTKNNAPIIIDRSQLEEVDSFIYLGSIITVDGATEEDAKARIGKAKKTALNILNNIWKTKNPALRTKQNILNWNVKSILLYGSETWKITTIILMVDGRW